MEFLTNYGLFAAKAVTILVFIWLLLSLIVGLSHKHQEDEQVEIKNINKKYQSTKLAMQQALLSKKEAKELVKKHKKEQKNAQDSKDKKRVFVINFVGNIKATAAKHLRKEITALLTVATSRDEVVVCLENSGGLVHEHGCAASQLERIKQRGIPLTVAVDKVAASGGYMMACVADRIVAAPFSIIGSIGVLAQLPNFHRLLDKYGIEFEQIKAGELKRTLTMFGKNTDEDRARFSEQMEDTHELFKEFVAEQRVKVNIQEIATGEHWLGKRALELNLIDELITSDDYLLNLSENADIYAIKHSEPKTLSEKITGGMQGSFEKALTKLWERNLFNG